MPQVLDSVKRLTYPKTKLETIVVDNASTDGSVAFLKKHYPFVRIVQCKKNLGYPALNKGLEVCKGEFCFLLNNDIEIHPECIKELLKIFEQHPKAVMAAPAMYWIDSRRPIYTKKYISRSFCNGSETNPQYAHTTEEAYTGVPFCKVSFARSLPYVIDWDYFLYVDDIDLGFRVRSMGYTIHRAPKARLYHEGCATTKKVWGNPFLTYCVEKNIIQTYVKNLQAKNIVLWSPYLLFYSSLKLFRSILTLNLKNSAALTKAWLWNLGNLKKILRKRKDIQERRRVSDRRVFKKMGNEWGVLRYMLRSS